MQQEEMNTLDVEALQRRLNKVIGQCQGVGRMIDRKAPCADILLQISAAKSALHKVAELLLVAHLAECAQKGVEAGSADKIIRDEKKAVYNFCRFMD